MTELTKTGEDLINEYFTSYYEGEPVRFIKNKFTKEVTINADDVVRTCTEHKTFEELLSSDEGLDFINQWKKDHPDMPFFGGAVKKNY